MNRLLATVWFGLAAGLAQGCFVLLGRSLALPLGTGQHMAWMAPLADVALFVLCAIPLLACGRLAVPVLCFLALASVACNLSFARVLCHWGLPRLHDAATLLLCAGLAVNVRHLPLQVVRRTLPWMVAAVVLLALCTRTDPWGTPSVQAAAARDRTNVLLIVMDTVRAANMSMYGYGRPTSPFLQQLGRQGVVFDRAISTSSWTLPSHGSMFTGYYPKELSASWKSALDDAHPTLAELLRADGYSTAGLVGNNVYCDREFGLARGFSHYEDESDTLGEALGGVWLGQPLPLDKRVCMMSPQINARFLAWLDKNRGKPFFTFLNYYDVHERFSPSPPQRFPEVHRRLWSGEGATAAAFQMERDAYDASMTYLDAQIGELMGELERRGLRKNTLVVVTSDHGELLGEKGELGHGIGLQIQTLHVPLLMVGPRLPAGRHVHSAVSLRDVPAMVADLVGAPLPTQWSMARYWEESGAGMAYAEHTNAFDPSAEAYHFGWGRSLVEGNLHYIQEGFRESVYDYEADPAELHSLNCSDRGRRAMQRFRQYLAREAGKFPW